MNEKPLYCSIWGGNSSTKWANFEVLRVLLCKRWVVSRVLERITYAKNRLIVLWMCCFAVSFCMASVKVMCSGLVVWMLWKPACISRSSSSTHPARAMTGIFRAFPFCSILPGILPIKLCRSMRPSPVMMRSASAILSSKWQRSSRRLAPGFSSAWRNAIMPPPIPPAAPLPGMWLMSFPVSLRMTCAKDCIPSSKVAIMASSAPFCRAKTCAAPSGP